MMTEQATIVTTDVILHKGLVLVGFSIHRVQNVSRTTNLERFRGHYGSNPVVYAMIWEDLHLAVNNTPALVDSASSSLTMFLMAVYFLRCYATETQLAARFQVCEKTARTWSFFYAKKIQELKHRKVRIVLQCRYI
jgi:hypothetical protein